MTPERWQKIDALFQAAVARPRETRTVFLHEHCAGDEAMRREVEALLASDETADTDLDEIASGVAAGWASENTQADLIGQTIGRYQIISPLGSGGMGEVFLAHDTMLDRKVAVKLLPRQFTLD